MTLIWYLNTFFDNRFLHFSKIAQENCFSYSRDIHQELINHEFGKGY